MDAERAPLQSAIDALSREAGNGTVRLGDLLDAFEDRSVGFVFLVFGLIASLPVIGALPGLPAVTALVILLTVGHAFVGGRTRFWAPEAVRRQRVDADRVSAWLERVRPVGRWIDGLVGPRLAPLADGPFARLALALEGVGLALAMTVLSIVPFLVLVASVGLMLLGLALMARDGLMALLGHGFALATLAAAAWAVQAAA